MASLSVLSLSKLNSLIPHCSRTHNPFSGSAKNRRNSPRRSRRLTVLALTEGSAKKSSKSEQEEQPIPSWAKPDSEEPPPWARNEARQSSSTFELPFYVYLLASAITAIAAIGSVFEYINQKPVFGVLESDSIFYAPVLGFFAFTGIPTSVRTSLANMIFNTQGYLWFNSVQTANKEAEEQDRRGRLPLELIAL